MKITKWHRQLLALCERGADVVGYRQACMLRECERHGLVTVTKPTGRYDGRHRLPYFGAITTAKGMRVARGGEP